jgi:K+-sensing histidine kinase KdpD
VKENRLARYVVSILTVALTLGIRLALNPLFGGRYPYIVFFLAVMVAAWYGGLGPGLLATALTAFSALFFFQPPLDKNLQARGVPALAGRGSARVRRTSRQLRAVAVSRQRSP